MAERFGFVCESCSAPTHSRTTIENAGKLIKVCPQCANQDMIEKMLEADIAAMDAVDPSYARLRASIGVSVALRNGVDEEILKAAYGPEIVQLAKDRDAGKAIVLGSTLPPRSRGL